MTLMRIIGTLIAVLPMVGCGSIYVANVRFTSVEVCTEELASRIKPNEGCLPPARASSVQSVNMVRYRHQVGEVEANRVSVAARTHSAEEVKAGTSGAPRNLGVADGRGANEGDSRNLLPSWLGRTFKVTPDQLQCDPVSGNSCLNVEFLPTGDFGKSAYLALDTQVYVRTDISGVVQQKLAARVDLNPTQLAERAVKASGIGGAVLGTSLADALADQVLTASFYRESVNAGRGTYYYVSLSNDDLDSLISVLQTCGLLDQSYLASAKGTSTRIARVDASASVETRSGSTTPMRVGGAASADANVCSTDSMLRDRNEFSLTARAVVLDLINAATKRRDVDQLGLVIGAALLRTEGISETCSSNDIGLIRDGKSTQLSNSTCSELRAIVDAAVLKVTPAAAPTPAPGTTPSDDQKASLVLALQAEIAKTSVRTNLLYPHTSVLALHWLPLRVAPAR